MCECVSVRMCKAKVVFVCLLFASFCSCYSCNYLKCIANISIYTNSHNTCINIRYILHICQ